MPTLATDVDMPDLTSLDRLTMSVDEQRDQSAAAAEQSWIARNMFGFSILHYDDVVAMLRDKRWHSASGKILEMSGIENPEWIAQEALVIMAQRMPDLEVAGEITWKPATVGIFGPDHLPIRFTPT